MTRTKPFVTVERLLRGYGLTPSRLAKLWGCSYNTARARLERPSTLTLGELEAVSMRAGIPMQEIRDSIKR